MANINSNSKTLPDKVKAFLISVKASEINLVILEKGGVLPTDYSKVTRVITRLFNKDLKVADLPATLKKDLKLDEKAVNNLASDIVGARLLVIKDWLKEDLESYIKQWGGNPADYQHYITEHQQALIEEEKYFAEQAAPDPIYVFKPKLSTEEPTPILDIAKEKIDSIALFREGLADLLKTDDAADFIQDYNLILISLLSDDQPFRLNLENTFYANTEEITTGRLKSEEKEVAPTIANWLKDFIKINGSEMFDQIALANYLSTSENIKKISAQEKNTVRRLLELYRNLAFFPASMGEAPLTEWQIIPVKAEIENTSDNLSARTSRPNSPAKPLTTSSLSKIPKPTPVAAAEPTIQELAEMEDILNKYGPSSLEHKAVKQEIAHAKKRGAKK